MGVKGTWDEPWWRTGTHVYNKYTCFFDQIRTIRPVFVFGLNGNCINLLVAIFEEGSAKIKHQDPFRPQRKSQLPERLILLMFLNDFRRNNNVQDLLIFFVASENPTTSGLTLRPVWPATSNVDGRR